MTVGSERPRTPARVEPGKSSQVLPGSGQPQDHCQGCLCMCRPALLFRFHLSISEDLITCVGTVSLAGPLIPLSRSTFLMIAVFHHPPPFRHNRRSDKVHPSWEVNPLPVSSHHRLAPTTQRVVVGYTRPTSSPTPTSTSHYLFHTFLPKFQAKGSLAKWGEFLALDHLVPGSFRLSTGYQKRRQQTVSLWRYPHAISVNLQ